MLGETLWHSVSPASMQGIRRHVSDNSWDESSRRQGGRKSKKSIQTQQVPPTPLMAALVKLVPADFRVPLPHGSLFRRQKSSIKGCRQARSCPASMDIQ